MEPPETVDYGKIVESRLRARLGEQHGSSSYLPHCLLLCGIIVGSDINSANRGQALKLPFKVALDYDSRLFSRKLTILSTMVSKVDRTVDCRDFKKKNATVATSRLSIFRGFCYGFFIGFQWESGRIRTKYGVKIFKNYRQSQQSTTW